MGFFGFLKRDKKDNALKFDQEPSPPPAPSPEKLEEGQNLPPAPKPLDIGSVGNEPLGPPPQMNQNPWAMQPLQEDVRKPFMDDDTKRIFLPPLEQGTGRIRPGSSSLPPMPKQDTGKPLEIPDIPKTTFANKFGTSPDPDMQKKIEEQHKDIKEAPRIEHKPDVQEPPSFLFSGRIDSGKEKTALHEEIDKKIDEHVEQKTTKRYSENIFSKEEDAPKTFSSVPEKKVQEPMPADTPLFVSVDSCEDIIYNINNIRETIKGKRDIHHEIMELQKKEDDIFNAWKGSLESIQAVVIKIDKKMFKQVV